MICPAAYFDTLSLGERISALVLEFSRPELHLLSYAACLLSLYEGRPVADWGYEFVSTTYGLPFSADIDASFDLALSLQLVRGRGELMQFTREGHAEVKELRELEENKTRDRYIEGATDSLLVFSPGNVREAFNYDPTMKYLRNRRTDWLFSSPEVDRLYSNFRQLREALDYEPRDLSVPMVSWLKYLIQSGRTLSDDHGTD
jgi:hypothetical protein